MHRYTARHMILHVLCDLQLLDLLCVSSESSVCDTHTHNKKRLAKKLVKEKACSSQKSAREQQKENKTGANVTFTDSELSKFLKAYEEGYDIKTNTTCGLKCFTAWTSTIPNLVCPIVSCMCRQTFVLGKHVCNFALERLTKKHTDMWTTSIHPSIRLWIIWVICLSFSAIIQVWQKARSLVSS